MSRIDGLDGAALDRWITGNWGEDSVSEIDPACEDCRDENRAEDPDWTCGYEFNRDQCVAEARADALYDAWKDGDLR